MVTNTEDVDFSFAEGQVVGDDISETLKVVVLVACTPDQLHFHFCFPRSDTPLIYKAVPSWFVRVEHMVDQLMRNNDLCYW